MMHSIKVRLERFFLAAIALLLGFQFHKGAIRTIMDFIYAMLLLHFNSIKVRLERRTSSRWATTTSYFNSIKVRLEHNRAAIAEDTHIEFQFHKGAIRTPT